MWVATKTVKNRKIAYIMNILARQITSRCTSKLDPNNIASHKFRFWHVR